MTDHTDLLAARNLFALSTNPYPGRGFVVGVNEDINIVHVYFLTGRSENSRNRVMTADGSRIFTEAANPAKVADPRLIMYNAMRQYGSDSIVSNGDQTDSVISKIEANPREMQSLSRLLRDRQYEPDVPHFTPRITALVSLGNVPTLSPLLQIVILRRSTWYKSDACERMQYAYHYIAPGFGFFMSTYAEKGDLAPFSGEPQLMPLRGDATTIGRAYWEALSPKLRVSLAVKIVKPNGEHDIHIINEFTKMA